MKKPYTLLLLASMLCLNLPAMDVPGDTIGKSTNFVPRFSPTGSTTMVKDPEGGYVYGTGRRAPFQDQNGAPLGVVTGVAQGYEVNEPVQITHILARIPVVIATSEESPSKAVFAIHPVQNNAGYEGAQQTQVPGPGTSTSSAEKTLQELEASQGGYTVVALPAPVDVQSDFAISCTFTSFVANNDSLAFLTDAQGNGLAMKYCWRMVSITNFWDRWFTASTWAQDINVALFAVTSGTTAISGDTPALNKAVLYPNPASGLAQLEFNSDKVQNFNLTWLDASGNVIKKENLGKRTTGKHIIQNDLSAFASGTYFYILEAEDGSNIARSFVLSR
ncbi:MAG: T9SS type A sorting domain-containing protein [Bacteroidia bacterium]|nr:T9SS type A sorting domain-containing protein [Bacteroidia bacterium]MCC6769112.1 T9SS type A sorting domain-containing protein [Bacteroidia bacterium]